MAHSNVDSSETKHYILDIKSEFDADYENKYQSNDYECMNHINVGDIKPDHDMKNVDEGINVLGDTEIEIERQFNKSECFGKEIC